MSSTDVSAIGVVDPAFFVGRQVLLRWVNSFFKLNYTKVEQAASGALHCQILDACFPGKVPMHKVNFAAREEYEFTMNWKIFDKVFAKLGIAKHVPVERLIKGKFQDNLEMLQWMKAFFDAKYNGEPYDAEARRSRSKGGGGPVKTRRRAKNTASQNSDHKTTSLGAPRTTAARKPLRPANRATGAPARRKGSSGGSNKPQRRRSPKTATTTLRKASSMSKQHKEEIARLNGQVADVEKERDFYLDKLREIEILCQQDDDVESALKGEILKILYATDENDEFQAPPVDEEEEDAAESAADNPLNIEKFETVSSEAESEPSTLSAETPGDLVRTIQEQRNKRTDSIMPTDDFLSLGAGSGTDFLGGLENNLAF